jgi:RNA polymerase sigma factor (sigma-70 family)
MPVSPPPGLLGEAGIGYKTAPPPIDDASSAKTDADLVDAAARGIPLAFEDLYRRHANAAWGVAYAVVHNRDDASDAVADAFTRIFRLLPTSRTVDFRAYLLTATRNAAVDIVRRSKRVAPEPVESVVGDGERDAVGRDPVVAREDGAIIGAAFGRLPERWRSALWLIDVEELSTREAGAILGVSPNNAAQLAARGRGRQREE